MVQIHVVPKRRPSSTLANPKHLNSALGTVTQSSVSADKGASTTNRQEELQLRKLPNHSRSRVTWSQVFRAINHIGSWALVVILVTSQFACILWNSQTTEQYMIYGQDPADGPFHIAGYNDEPYSDRCLVCVQQGRLYRPMQLSAALMPPKAEVVDTTGESVNGYRVVSRQQIDLQEKVAQRYALACDVVAATLTNIVSACNKLGYNVVNTSSNLHVINGVSSNVTWRIRASLPVLIVPYWDNAIYARYFIPGEDGSACVFHPDGRFLVAESSIAALTATNRSTIHSKTSEWLRIPSEHGAVWRNGWLEDPTTGSRWYSDMGATPTDKNDRFGIRQRYFDLLRDEEVDCVENSSRCDSVGVDEWWGDEFFNTVKNLWATSITISDGSRYGLFLYEATDRSSIHSLYVIATLISNTTVAALLARWLVASVALLKAYRRGHSRGFSTPGIGCLACTRSFELLPLILLPRMTNALAAFFTAACRFEGEQQAISEAWFVIYPSIAEVMLYYFSLLNLMAKLMRRRMSDELFGPSLAFLCLLHWLRRPLANSGLFEFDGRVATVMTAIEYEQLRLVDFFTTRAALRLNGNVWSIFGIKMAVLGINLLPLLFARKTSLKPWPWGIQPGSITRIEQSLGVRASDSSGLGVSPMYVLHDRSDEATPRRLDCYELVRFGYVVFGNVFVVSVSDWIYTILLGSALQLRRRASAFRVLAFRVPLEPPTTDAPPPQQPQSPHEVRSASAARLSASLPTLLPLHSPLLRNVDVWDVSARALP